MSKSIKKAAVKTGNKTGKEAAKETVNETALAAKAGKSANGAPRVAAVQRAAPINPPTAPSKDLHVFPNPAPDRDYAIQFQIPEFTCLCPLTGQPDFAHFVIDIVADRLCVELKSLKMYMWSFREEGAFHEKVTNDILSKIVSVTAPRYARISAHWYVRGGITTNVVAEHRKKGWKPLPPVELVAHPDATRAQGALR
jgi:7-cyano-7-deazaguanine reductase